MDRKDILKKIGEGLKQMNKWSLNRFVSEPELMDMLNPSFGMTRERGVYCVDMKEGPDLSVKALPRGFGGEEKRFGTEKLSDIQLTAISDMIDKILKTERDIRKTAQKAPFLEDMLPNIEKWAKKCAEQAGKQFSAYVSFGKRAIDRQKYYAVVICENNDQIGSISLVQDKNGKLMYNEREPLYGQWDKDRLMPIDKMFSLIKESVEHITRKSFKLDDTKEKEKLEEDIKKAIDEWADKGMTYDLEVEREGKTVAEKWKLDFAHVEFEPQKVQIVLYGIRKDVDGAKPVMLASGTFNPEAKKETFLMEARGENVAVLEALENDRKVDIIDLWNMPGEEKEAVIDMEELYGKYLRCSNRQYFYSPFSDIEYHKETKALGEGKLMHCLKAMIAGVTPLIGESDKLAAVLDKIKNLPQYDFIGQQLAHKVFSRQQDLFLEAQDRVSDISIYKTSAGYNIRCCIDGEQMSGKPVSDFKRQACLNAEDKQMALKWLAATSYRDKLEQQQVVSDIRIRKDIDGNPYISCNVYGERQLAKKMKPEHFEYYRIRMAQSDKAFNGVAPELAQKYYAKEIADAQLDRKQSQGMKR